MHVCTLDIEAAAGFDVVAPSTANNAVKRALPSPLRSVSSISLARKSIHLQVLIICWRRSPALISTRMCRLSRSADDALASGTIEKKQVFHASPRADDRDRNPSR